MFTITAESAKLLSNYSRTYNALLVEAENAIMAATMTARPMSTEIDFTGVDEETTNKVSSFLEDRGFFVNVRRLNINSFECKLKISWF